MESNHYYVYAYLDPRKPGPFGYGDYSFTHEPFYIGKGKGDRARDHLSKYSLEGPNKLKNNKIKKILNEGHSPIITKVTVDLTEALAHSEEIKLIAAIGRANTVGGPLTNNTDGGEGSSGAICSQESRKLLSKQRKGKKQTEAQYAANCSRRQTPEHRRKISEAQKGVRRLSDEQYALIAEKNRGTKRSDETRALLSSQRKGKAQTPAQYEATLERARRAKEKNNFLSFAEFKTFVSGLDPELHKARNLLAYLRAERPARVPRNPYTTYRGEWTSWNDIFGR